MPPPLGVNSVNIAQIMSDNLDNNFAHELSAAIHELKIQITEIRTLFTEWSPVLKTQVHALSQMENRMTRVEDKVENVKKAATDDCTGITARMEKESVTLSNRISADAVAAQETLKAYIALNDKRADNNYRLGQIAVTVLGLLLALTAFLSHVRYQP